MSTVGLRPQLKRDEETRNHAYKDSLGFWTYATGHLIDRRKNGYLPDHIVEMFRQLPAFATGDVIDNLIARGDRVEIPQAIGDSLLEHDISVAIGGLTDALPWFMELSEVRRATLINMAFQLGVAGLLQFHLALAYMRNGEWTAASMAFADSKVAREQTPKRWARHCEQIRTGEWQ